MAKKENMSSAEKYREERKERIAKANKKNAKNLAVGKAAAGIGKKIVAIVLVVAIVIGIGYYVSNTFGIAENLATALKVGDSKVTATEFEYYYSAMYQQTSYYASYYSQYGYDMGFDSNTALDAQTTTDEDGNEITYAEYFKDQAKQKAQFVMAYYNEAQKAGYELGEEDLTTIDETIASYEENATENGISLGGYLKNAFSNGMTEKKFKKLLEIETIASNYYTQKQEELADAVTDERINAEYEENRAKYDYADVVYYSFAYETLTAEDDETDDALKARQEKANKAVDADAKEVLGKVKDAKSFNEAVKAYLASQAEEAEAEDAETEETAETEDTTYTTELKTTSYDSVSSAISEDAAKWALSADRKAGDKKLFTTDSGSYIVLVTKAAYTGHSVDVRHILISFDAEDEDNVTDEEKAAAKEKAEALLKEWKEGDATEESFAALVADNSGDEGSLDNGGLYEGIRLSSSYVENFLNWAMSSKRKVGDTGIVETEYGYHIMYFSADNKDDLDWADTIRTNFGSEDFEAYDEELLAEDGAYAINPNDFWVNYATNKFCKKIAYNIAYSSNS